MYNVYCVFKFGKGNGTKNIFMAFLEMILERVPNYFKNVWVKNITELPQ